MVLKLSSEQLAALDRLEKGQFVEEVHRELVAKFPEYGNDETLGPRLHEAYRHAVSSLGFTQGPALTQFLHYEAAAPRFYRDPAIDAWLRKPGRLVEERWADLLSVVKSKLKEY